MQVNLHICYLNMTCNVPYLICQIFGKKNDNDYDYIDIELLYLPIYKSIMKNEQEM